MVDTVATIDTIIDKLSKNELTVTNVPEKFRNDIRIISYERKVGLRITERRGYDVIRNSFFVEDVLIIADRKIRRTEWHSFKSFDDYYQYLCGDIYENACYTFYGLDVGTANRYKINKDKFFEKRAFIEFTIDDYTLEKLSPDLKTQNLKDVHYLIKKEYRNNYFYVRQIWRDSNGKLLKCNCQKFSIFFDFVYFLKGDLSNAELISCNGLVNLNKECGIDFSRVKLTSFMCDKFGINYNNYVIKPGMLGTFKYSDLNECDTIDKLEREIVFADEDEVGHGIKSRIYYVSDIHLLHKAKNNGAKSREDYIYIARKVAETIARQTEELVLIGGDVTSDFGLFRCFVSHLSEIKSPHTDVVFILGNHELWSFQDRTLDQTVSRYRDYIESHGMYFLQNDLLYITRKSTIARKEIHVIRYCELNKMKDSQIFNLLRNSSCVILGGMGFSGYNIEFNADKFVYRRAVNRTEEIKETYRFEALYDRLKTIMPPNNTIILTHMPKKDWSKNKEYDNHFIYISGHTHRNAFYDDGIIRVYSDNQSGYRQKELYMKHFIFSYEFDYFYDYEDGVHIITREQYQEFIRGKNISMVFERKIDTLYMLKKNGYYCFICKTVTGKLTILNGGSIKKLPINDIYYYYNNMDTVVSWYEEPLTEYTKYQRKISDIIKKIGGFGWIHGCIIDIDFYNHVYLNPLDCKLTCYWANDIVCKIAYPSLPALLQDKLPQLFVNYNNLVNNEDKNLLSVYEEKTDIDSAPQLILETDIYKTSQVICKMQKLEKKILNIWPESMPVKGTKQQTLLIRGN